MKPDKRETGLINMSIVNRTKKVFPDETKLMLASTNLMRRITSISKIAIEEFSIKPNLPAVMVLFARNRELVHFSIVCLWNGGYASAKVLLRAAVENTLCMSLFNKNPELAKEWFSNPEKFRKEWQPGKIRDELFPKESRLWIAYREFYRVLSEYVHPSFKGWSEQFYEDKFRESKSILWHPIFNPDYASECIGLIFFAIVQSFKEFINSFGKWFPENAVREVNKVLPKVSQMVSRHFILKREGKVI